MVEANVIGDSGQVGPVVGHVGAALAGLDKIEGALDVVTFAALHGGFHFPFASEFFEVQVLEFWFGIRRF